MVAQSTLLLPSTRKLEVRDKRILTGQFRQPNGCWMVKELNLTDVLDVQQEGRFEWHPCPDPAKWDDLVEGATVYQSTLVVTVKGSDGTKKIVALDLGEYIFNVSGEPKYVPEPIIIPSDFGLVDGNINASAFAVASDPTRDRCRIAYRTHIEDKVSLAEVTFKNGRWHAATEIEVYPGLVPRQNFALAYHPVDPKKRSLFFSPENGDGYIYQQEFNDGWQEPHLLRGHDNRKREVGSAVGSVQYCSHQKEQRRLEGPKAHRFSKFATTHVADPFDPERSNLILLYYVDESNGLQEIVGKQKTTGEYEWTRTTLMEEEVLPNGFIAVAQKDRTTYVVFRNVERALCLAVGTRKNSGKADWQDTIVIRESYQISKNSPLAIVPRRTEDGEQKVTVFYLQRQGSAKYIWALDYKPNDEYVIKSTTLEPRRVGKIEPDSILGAASFQNDKREARLFSVSCLDGDNILLERVPRRPEHGIGSDQWALACGIVDTDVDHL
ncbi:hypothetical protein BDZ91DRAFT_736748 [Kalaharituber pfeilii]|nr:hypothetical protein BDZ91DRAFT_736748 [Kalaharituber pfeilii]